jgi:CubicO group peptidase (beta-lactamase class C family)
MSGTMATRVRQLIADDFLSRPSLRDRGRWRTILLMLRSWTPAVLLVALLGVAPAGLAQSPERENGEAPTGVRLNAAMLADVYARAAELPRLRSLLVSQHGQLVRERYFNGARRSGRTNIKSASKSIISALVGIAVRDGKLELTQRVGEFFPQYVGPPADPRVRDVTVEDLLTMRAGLQSTSFEHYGRWVTSRNWVRHVLTRPFEAPPGGPMIYSTGSTHLLSAILTKVTGMSTREYANRQLGRPLGIVFPRWRTDPQGVYFGGNDMYLTPREMLAFGQLYLSGGRSAGRQVLPRAWVDSTVVPRTRSGWSGHEYGYGWWLRDSGGYRVSFAWGYGGQFVFVVPELELIVVATSDANVRSRGGGHLDEVHAMLDEIVRRASLARLASP